MKITIQAVKSRESNVLEMLKRVEAEVYYDEELKGAFHSFVKMLDIDFEDYKLHLQDDVILPLNFDKYLDVVEEDMKKNNIEVLSLFAPNRKGLIEANKQAEKYVPFHPYLWLQATVFSKRAVEGLKAHLSETTETKHDDVFVQEWLRKSKTKAFVHLPSIVQHNTYLGSVMGNPDSPRRMSPVYDKNFCSNNL